jgi:hypothetical protein
MSNFSRAEELEPSMDNEEWQYGVAEDKIAVERGTAVWFESGWDALNWMKEFGGPESEVRRRLRPRGVGPSQPMERRIPEGWVYKRIQVTVEIEVPRPPDDTGENLEFYYNEGTWCAENLPDLIEEHQYRVGHRDSCMTRRPVIKALD